MAPCSFPTVRRRLLLLTLLAVVVLMLRTSLPPEGARLHQRRHHAAPAESLICPCQRSRPSGSPVGAAPEGSSFCGQMADRRGLQQNVISYSVFGSMSSPFFRGIALNAELAERLYPDWVIRVYHNYNLTEPQTKDQICNLTCRQDGLAQW